MKTANVNWEIIKCHTHSKWFLCAFPILVCFWVFTFILRKIWWRGTVLIFPAGKDAKAVGRLSSTDSHHPQVVVELEFEIRQSGWLEEPCSACPTAPSWLMEAICGSSLLGPRAWAALPSTGPDSPDETDVPSHGLNTSHWEDGLLTGVLWTIRKIEQPVWASGVKGRDSLKALHLTVLGSTERLGAQEGSQQPGICLLWETRFSPVALDGVGDNTIFNPSKLYVNYSNKLKKKKICLIVNMTLTDSNIWRLTWGKRGIWHRVRKISEK